MNDATNGDTIDLELPFISCLCPTFRRQEHLARSVEMFKQQSYPVDRRELIILDDGQGKAGGSIDSGVSHWCVEDRFDSLPSKYWWLLNSSGAIGEVFSIWEDDDEYKPDHLLNHAKVIQQGHGWSKPSQVWSDYHNPPAHGLEPADGRFFASIAFTRELLHRVGGFVQTKRADFDQQFIQRLTAAERPGDPCQFGEPQYVFRWHTGAYHGQHFMTGGPSDETWYDRAGRQVVQLLNRSALHSRQSAR